MPLILGLVTVSDMIWSNANQVTHQMRLEQVSDGIVFFSSFFCKQIFESKHSSSVDLGRTRQCATNKSTIMSLLCRFGRRFATSVAKTHRVTSTTTLFGKIAARGFSTVLDEATTKQLSKFGIDAPVGG